MTPAPSLAALGTACGAEGFAMECFGLDLLQVMLGAVELLDFFQNDNVGAGDAPLRDGSADLWPWQPLGSSARGVWFGEVV